MRVSDVRVLPTPRGLAEKRALDDTSYYQGLSLTSQREREKEEGIRRSLYFPQQSQSLRPMTDFEKDGCSQPKVCSHTYLRQLSEHWERLG